MMTRLNSDYLRIIIAGGRHRDATEAIGDTFGELEDAGMILSRTRVTVVHGGCPTGVDAQANMYAATHGYRIEPHPADWARYSRSAGPRRNEDMALLGADVCLAFPDESSPGTWDMIHRALAHGIRTVIIPKEVV